MHLHPRHTLLAIPILLASCVQAPPPSPYGAIPTKAQLAWQQMEINMMCHFGPNTFTGLEWGSGLEAEAIFNPSQLDCRQWVDVAEMAGMNGIILTAKHHDGFCLWPSQYSQHTVAQSPWRDGNGDVLREFSAACDGRIKKGFYLSPWDRNAPSYGTSAYNDLFIATLTEVLSSYGSTFEQWFDGANGEGPNGKRQTYDWTRFNATVAKLQPNAVVFSDVGPGCRWVGNEDGMAGETCWSTLTTESYEPGAGAPPQQLLTHGQPNGRQWLPVEADVSLRPRWFYHADETPKTTAELMEIYFNTVGHNALLLLNVPITPQGRIDATDSLRLAEFRAQRDRMFAHDLAQHARAKGHHRRGRNYSPQQMLDTNYHTYWAMDDSATTAEATIRLDGVQHFDCIILQEYIPLGQRISAFHIDYQTPDRQWHPCTAGTTIGYKRILRTDPLDAIALRLVVDSALATPVINRFSIYNTHE